MKILYVHNKMMWFRLPYFNRISEIYDVKFIFTDEENVRGLKADYQILKSYGNHIFGITPGLIKVLIREKYDLLVFPSISSPYWDLLISFIIVKFRGKPYIWGSDRWYIPKREGFFRDAVNNFRDKFISLVARNATAYYVPGVKHYEFARFLGILEEKIFIIPNASMIDRVSGDYDKAQEIISKLNLGNKKRLLFVGRLVEYKGVKYLLQAFAELKKNYKDVCLIIVGDNYFEKENKGKSIEELKFYCAELNIQENVIFTGDIDRDQIALYFLLSNIFILPSTTYGNYNEAWGLVINEAMAFGKPVISTVAVGGAHALIKDGVNGYIVPEKNVGLLCESIKKIVEDPELEKKMGLESKRIIEEGFTYEHMVEGFKCIIDKIMAGSLTA